MYFFQFIILLLVNYYFDCVFDFHVATLVRERYMCLFLSDGVRLHVSGNTQLHNGNKRFDQRVFCVKRFYFVFSVVEVKNNILNLPFSFKIEA